MKVNFKLYFLFLVILLTACSSQTSYETLSGKWFGPIEFKDNIKDPNCKYEGIMHLVLDEVPEDIQGVFFINITDIKIKEGACLPLGPSPPQILKGNADAGKIKLVTENKWIEFEGNYDMKKIVLHFESCHDQICADGSKGVGSIGDVELERLVSS